MEDGVTDIDKDRQSEEMPADTIPAMDLSSINIFQLLCVYENRLRARTQLLDSGFTIEKLSFYTLSLSIKGHGSQIFFADIHTINNRIMWTDVTYIIYNIYIYNSLSCSDVLGDGSRCFK